MDELLTLIKPQFKSRSEMPFRQGVLGIVINNENEFLIVQMVTYAKNQWRLPGGGLDLGETHEQALLRELEEELGSNKFEIVKASSEVIKYNWPINVVIDQIKNKNRYFRGQEQRQFLVKFSGKKEDLHPDPNELRQIKWVTRDELKKYFIFKDQLAEAEKTFKDLEI